VSLLPFGAYALSLALQSNLAVELGMDDNAVAQLNLVSTVVFALACVAGGWVSDRFGRRSSLALFVFLTVIPTLWLAYAMQQAGWIMPIDVKAATGRAGRGAARHVLGCGHRVQRVPGPVLRRALGAVHGRDDAGGRRHPVHGLHGAVEPRHHLHLVVAGHSLAKWGTR
jgi:nitrate/nitrite transporter NarK